MDSEPARFDRFTAQVLRWRWALLLLVALATLLFARELPSLHVDNSNENWLVEGDESLRLIRKFNDLFGSDDFVYVLLRADGDFFRAEPIRRMSQLAQALEEHVPHVVDTTWLGNAEFIEGREDRIDIEELMATLPVSASDLDRVRARALAEPVYLDNLISRDGATAGVLLEMDAYPEEGVDPRKDVAPAVRAVLARPEYADLDLIAVGGPLLDYDLDRVAATEGQKLGLICLAIQMLILFWVGRGLRGVLVPAVVVVLSVIWTFGGVAMTGTELNAIVAMVPVLLICVGIGDAMHVIAEFQQQQRLGLERGAALRRAMSLVGWPCGLTSLTTAVGFLSFLAAPIRPYREMGVYAAAGVLVTVALTFVVVPVLYSWGPARRQDTGRSGDIFDRLLRGAARLVARRPLGLVLVFGALGGVALVGYARLEIETNPLEMFKPSVPIRRAMETVDVEMGGSMSVELMLDTGKRDGIVEPAFLAKLDALDRFVVEHPSTTKSTSVLDIFRQMRRAFHENRSEYYDIPTTREEAAQYLLLYELSGGEDKEKLVPSENDVARLTARTRALSTRETEQLFADVRAFTRQELQGVATLEMAGTLDWVRAMTERLQEGQQRSFAAAFSVIALVMMAVLRSVRLGLISMIPNVFPIWMTLGLLGWMGRPMDLMMMGFSALVIGVVVDDTIHFFLRFRREFARLGGYASAVEATLSTVGRPLTFTTMTLTLGFAAMSFSKMTGIANFGVLSGFAFSWALLADFLFAPALLLLVKPLGPERGP